MGYGGGFVKTSTAESLARFYEVIRFDGELKASSRNDLETRELLVDWNYELFGKIRISETHLTYGLNSLILLPLVWIDTVLHVF